MKPPNIDPADVLLFAGLGALTIGAGWLHPALGFLAFGFGAMYLGLMAGRTPQEK
jgi:hypothetical protein